MAIPITPKASHALPFDAEDEVVPSLVEKMAVAGNTAELQALLGAPIEIAGQDAQATTKLFDNFLRTQNPKSLEDRGVALTAAAFLREYAHNVAIDVVAVRTAITTKLMEIANCGDRKHELRALELLGKHSDIGLFTERSEITIKHKSAENLEEEIVQRVQRLLHAETYDVTPVLAGLDEDVWSPETIDALAKIKPSTLHQGWEDPPSHMDARGGGGEEDAGEEDE